MTTADMITELQQLARSICVHPCSSVVETSVPAFLLSVADRLGRLEKLKHHFLDAEAAIRFDPACLSESRITHHAS